MYKKYEEKIPFKYYLFLGSFIIVLIMSRFTHVGMMSNTYTSIITLFTSTLTGTYFVFYLSKAIDNKLSNKNIIKKYFKYLGKNTYIALWLHLIAFKLITYLQIIIYNDKKLFLACYPVYIKDGIWSFLYALVGMTLPLIYVKAKEIIESKINTAKN